jgi:hypothetical protein
LEAWRGRAGPLADWAMTGIAVANPMSADTHKIHLAIGRRSIADSVV